MSRRALYLIPLAALVACQGGDTTSPAAGGPPSLVISDATHSPGNPDFFWLPPMVPDPSGSSLFDAGAFNPNLQPTVTICALDVANTAPETAVLPGTLCKAAGYSQVFAGSAVSLTGEQYHVNWRVPTSLETYYRIVASVGAINLGTADVKTATSGDATNFVLQRDGSTLSIKFRIERYALCAVPGTGPCSSETVDLAAGGDVSFTPTGSSAPSGVEIPPGAGTTTVTITVQSCDDFNPRATDLPTFGRCVRVTSDPALPPAGLTSAATVFVCDLGSVSGRVTGEAQEKRITLHRLDGADLNALPHVLGCPVVTSAVDRSLRGLLRNLAHGHWKTAGGQVLAMFAPTPLYARRRIDQGGGGATGEFSDFQFVLPAKMEKVAATDNQVALPGTTLPLDPKVVVTDLGGEFVAGARVTFTPSGDGTATPVQGVTGADGLVSTAWKLKTSAGANSLVASGRGIAGAGADNIGNGPREGVDPFQPIQAYFDGADPEGGPVEVPVRTGSQTFTATGFHGAVDGFDFQSQGYRYLSDVKNDDHITYFLTARNSDGYFQLGTVVVPAGWYLPSFIPGEDWLTGQAAFGAGDVCSEPHLAAQVHTAWSLNTDILVRKQFFTTAAGSLTITVYADNDVQIWLDGANISKLAPATPPYGHVEFGASGDSDDWFVHGNCANLGPPVITIAVGAGVHTLALRGDDYGVQSHLDAKVVFTP